jgi:outer membrane lipoprotein carrier protein
MLCVSFVAASAASGSESAADVLAAVQSHYGSIRDLRAEFVQASFVAAVAAETLSRGAVVVKRPGRMRWEYSDPEPRVIVMDEATLRIYTPRDRQMQIAPVGPDTVSPTAIGFLMGQGKLVEQFEAEFVRDSTPKDEKVGLRLTPRGDASFESLELWIDVSSSQLRESVLVDLFGNRTRVRFTRLVENQGVPDEAFAVDAPEGTEVIDLR